MASKTIFRNGATRVAPSLPAEVAGFAADSVAIESDLRAATDPAGDDVGLSVAPVDPEWDRFLIDSDRGGHTQAAAWGRVKAAVGWRPVRVIVRRDGEIAAGCQVLLRDISPLGVVGYAPGGPVLRTADDSLLGSVVAGMRRFARAERIRYLKLQPTDPALARPLRSRGFTPSSLDISPAATVRVALDRSPDEILAAMHRSTRRNIRKTERLGVTVRAGGAEDLATLHGLLQRTAERKAFGTHSLSYVETVWKVLGPDGHAKLLLAEHEGRVLAGVLLIGFGKTVWCKAHGWSGDRSNLRPNELLHWNSMLWARESGYRCFDFDGVDARAAREIVERRLSPEEARHGVAGYKLGFGGQIVILPGALDRGYGAMEPLGRLVAPRLGRYREYAKRMVGRR